MIFNTKKVLGYGIYPALFILFLIFFNNCRNQYEDDYYYDDRRYDRGYDDRYDRGSSRRHRNDSELRTVSPSSSIRFQPLKASQFDGEDCEEFEECRELCDEIFSRSFQDRCENFPEDMVEALYETYEDLKLASPSSLENIDPSALAVLMDMDDRFINSLKDDWGISGVSALLDYTAKNPLAVEAFQYGDNEEIFKDLLLEFARLNNKTAHFSTALSLNVARHRETLPALIKNADNETAMQFILDILSQECSDSFTCKKQALCVREDISRRASRQRSSDLCPYLGVRDRADYCYIQGPDVWSYIENLIYDGDIKDRDLANLELNEQTCDTFCSRNDCYL